MTSFFLGAFPIHPHQTQRVLIGCAGWSVPGALQENFPRTGSHLERYAAVLPAVEINTSFYRPHRPETYARWRNSVPDGFRFSVKVPRTITHEHRLQNVDALLSRFVQEVGNLGEKLGCLLVQLPPGLHFKAEVAHAFYAALTMQIAVPIVCEARHASWFSMEAASMLATLDVARVYADPPVVDQPFAMDATSSVYFRLHGSPVMYHSRYPDAFLQQVADQLRQSREQGKTAWCIFDNTASGAAMPNALSLLSELG